ncbi:MAG: PAS domain S-box protein [Actinobacteria bacterium]|nr:PAS domain S-box protein [Actinomycetota bacterium]
MKNVKSPCVLIVEDDADFASLLKKVIRKEFSADIEVAPDCASARDALLLLHPDLITLDQCLPDGSGLELLEEIMQKKEHPPVVMVTGNGNEGVAGQSCILGASGYVVKDREMKDLLTVSLKEALDSSRMKKALTESERRYRRLFEAARDGILILDEDSGLVIDVNPYILELLGYQRREIIGKRLWELGPFKNRDTAIAAFSELKSKGYVRYENLPLKAKDGREVDVEFVSNAYIEDRKKVIQCNIRNITRQKKLEKQISDSEKRYRGLYETMKEGVLYTDLGGRILNANDAVLGMLGYTLEEIRGLTYRDITPLKWHQVEAEIIDSQVLVSGYSSLYEKEFIRKDKTWFPIDIQMWLIRDDRGDPTGMWGMVRDITERKRSQEILERINTELNDFAFSVAHDLRGPISSLKLSSSTIMQIIAENRVESMYTDVNEIAGVIERNVTKLDSLTEDLLSLARTGQTPKELSRVSISGIIESLLEENSSVISQKKIGIETEGDLGDIVSDPTHIYQIFSNLINNAIKHNDGAGLLIRIAKLGDNGNGGHRFLVCDNGVGIDTRILDTVFDPFVKGEKGDTGMGLAIVKKIVGIYGGTVKAYNNNGACFEFSIKDIQGDFS